MEINPIIENKVLSFGIDMPITFFENALINKTGTINNNKLFKIMIRG